MGSTGEGLALDSGDKKSIIETATSLNIDIPIMAGVGGFNLRSQIEWLELCHDYEVDSFLLVTPLYAKPDVKGQISWFKSLLNAAERPCMLYNVPSRTGVELYPEVLRELVGHPNLFAIKEASGSIMKYQKLRRESPGLAFYSGDDSMTPYFTMAGCEGLVSVVANVWPEATHRYVEWCLDGRGPELVPIWQECIEQLFSASNPIPAKVLLKEKEWIKTDAMRPPLTPEDLKTLESLLEADDKIADWYKSTQ